MKQVRADAAYIHVPFCRRKCAYCDFYSLAGSENLIPDYLKSLHNEIIADAPPVGFRESSSLKTIYFGGGTPSLLSADHIASIIKLIRDHYGLAQDHEITMEANPESINRESIHAFSSAGVNRLSLGLQAVQPQLLAAIGRKHNAEDLRWAVMSAADAGIKHISVDLMIGLPGQTIADIDQSLDFVLGLPIDHVSFYSLIIEPDTPFYNMYSGQTHLLPDDDTERAMYHFMIEKLASAGFVTYEISNAAKPGSESRHNLVYWHARPYYGFGPSAHSYLDDIRRANCSDLNRYIEIWQHKDEPFSSSTVIETIDVASEQKEMLLLGLRLLAGVSFDSFKERFDIDMHSVFGASIKKLLSQGLLLQDEKCIRLSEKGLDFANQVFMEFV